MPGMLHARVIRPPAVGARSSRWTKSSLRGIPDARVVRVDNFLAVVAKDEWAAVRARRALEGDVERVAGLPRHDSSSVPARRRGRSRPGDRESRRHDAAMAGAAKTLSATYFWPFQSHASLGPSCAVADVRDDGTTIWTASQGIHGLRTTCARVRPARDRARDLPRRLRLVRHQRGRPRRGRRGAPLEDAPGSPCACSGRVRTSSDGIRKDRSSCSTCAPASTQRAASWPGTRRCGCPANAGCAALSRGGCRADSAGHGRNAGRHQAKRRPAV